MGFKSCPKCGANWIDGQLFWSTGKAGTDADLAGLVCDNYGDDQCINEAKGTAHSGQTWEKRLGYMEGAMDEFKRRQKELDELIE